MKKITIEITPALITNDKAKINITHEGWPDEATIPVAETIGILEIAKHVYLKNN